MAPAVAAVATAMVAAVAAAVAVIAAMAEVAATTAARAAGKLSLSALQGTHHTGQFTSLMRDNPLRVIPLRLPYLSLSYDT
jgi:hypothetical protein